MRLRRRFIWLAIAALAIGAGCVVYRGPGRQIVRGHVGDGGATMLVYALIGLVWPNPRRAWHRAAITMAIATSIELGQLFWEPSGTVGEMTIGSTFDGWDFVAYILGTIASVLSDRGTARSLARRAELAAP